MSLGPRLARRGGVRPLAAVVLLVLVDIRPGHYTLRLAPALVERFASTTPPSREVEMAASWTVLDGLDFILEARPTSTVSTPTTPAATAGEGPPPEPTVAPGTPASPAPAAPGSDGGVVSWEPGSAVVFAVQVAAYRDRHGADEEAAQLSAKLQRPCHVVAVELDTSGRWYRVVVGDFASSEEAETYRRQLAADQSCEVGPVRQLPAAGPLPGL